MRYPPLPESSVWYVKNVLVPLMLLFVAAGTLAAVEEPRDQRYADSEFSFSSDSVQVVVIDSYAHIAYPGSISDDDPAHEGRPDLPIVCEWFVLPDETLISDLEVNVTSWDTLEVDIVPIPLGPEGTDREPDPDYYETDAEYPRAMSFKARDVRYRGYHLGQIALYPVRWSPETGQLLVAEEVSLSIEVTPLTGEQSAGLTRVLRPEGADPWGEHREMLSGLVQNPRELRTLYPARERNPRTGGGDVGQRVTEGTPYGGTLREWPSPLGEPVVRWIIVDNQTLAGAPVGNIRQYASEYADWCTLHEQQTTSTIELSTIIDQARRSGTDAGKDVPEILQSFVQECYQAGTEFILLAGDLEIIPTRRWGGPEVGLPHDRLDPPSDINYVVFDTDWNADDDAWEWESSSDVAIGPSYDAFPQLAIGRLPIHDEQDAEAIFTKLREYRDPEGMQRAAPDPEYYTSALFATGMIWNALPTRRKRGRRENSSHEVKNWTRA